MVQFAGMSILQFSMYLNLFLMESVISFKKNRNKMKKKNMKKNEMKGNKMQSLALVVVLSIKK